MFSVQYPASQDVNDGPIFCRKCKCSPNNRCICSIATAAPTQFNCTWAQTGIRPLCSACAIATSAAIFTDRTADDGTFWIDATVNGGLIMNIGPFDTEQERADAQTDIDAMS
jgi:hypothetical protein